MKYEIIMKIINEDLWKMNTKRKKSKKSEFYACTKYMHRKK